MAEKTLDETVEQAGTLPQVYRPIEPSKSHDRGTFLYHQDTLNNLTKYRSQLDKDPNDLKAREDFSRKIFGDPTYHVGLSEVDMRTHVRAVHEDALEKMAHYAEHNFNELFNRLGDQSLQMLAFSVPLYIVKDNKGHNALVNLLGEVKEIEQIAEKEDIGKMRGYLLNAVEKDKTLPDYMKKIIRYLSKSESTIARVFANANQAKHAILSQALSTKDGKPKTGRLRSLIKDSLNSAKDVLEDEKDEGKKRDIWEDVIRPYYEKLAEVAYINENKKYHEEHSELSNVDQREEERRQLRMAA